ncbi:MAG: sensor histidine kinase [Mycobacteriales bacterium]
MPARALAASRASTAARALLLALCALLSIAGGTAHAAALATSLALLAAVAVVLARTRKPSRTLIRLAVLVEACIWAAGVLTTGADSSPLLPYLLAPAFAGGLYLGLDGVLVPVGSAALAILAGTPALVSAERFGAIARAAGEWVVLALLVGLLASWVQRLQANLPGPDNYLQAYRLLAQLRAVARRLPAGLDRFAVADGLVREVRGSVPQAAGAAVLVRGHGNRLSLLATSGAPLAVASVDVSGDSVFAEAWSTQRPALHNSTGVLPLVAGDRTSGLLVLTLSPTATLRGPDLTRAFEAVRDGALRLETALLFDELREVATVEERRRLAREIHDGVAQDLAAFGYQLDSLAHEVRSASDPDESADRVLKVRKDLGALVGELRHSIFELRSEVGQGASLGSALADFARTVGNASGLNVHLSLDESPNRLAADTEAELLRIAQEAINNSRKHAQAENLWIRCEVAPPKALIVVEDDGVGPAQAREDSFGLQIMRERAQRLRAELEVAPREPCGTVVTCRLERG